MGLSFCIISNVKEWKTEYHYWVFQAEIAGITYVIVIFTSHSITVSMLRNSAAISFIRPLHSIIQSIISIYGLYATNYIY